MSYPRNERKDDEFADYHNFLDTPLWPTGAKQRGQEATKDTAEMAPQYAAAALAKLIRWARYEPVGETARHHDEDSREDFVRRTMLGTHLAARSCNLDPEHFYGVYGEYGAPADAELHQVLAVMAVQMGDSGLADWSVIERADLALQLIKALSEQFRIVNRSS